MSDFLDGAKPVAAQSSDFLADAKPVAPPPSPAQPEGFWHSLGAQLGLTPEEAKAKHDEFMAHPISNMVQAGLGITPIKMAAKGLFDQVMKTGGELGTAAYRATQGDLAGAANHAVESIPIVGPAVNKMAANSPATIPGHGYMHQVVDDITPGNAGTALGAAAQAAPLVAGGIESTPVGDAALAKVAASKVAAPVRVVANVAQNLPQMLPDAVGQGVARAGRTLFPKNVSVAQDQISAQGLVKALVPDAAAIPGIKSAAAALPDALASAEKNGTAINGKLDLQKALTDRAAEVQGHYDNAILKPNAGDLNAVPDNYNGGTTTQGRATLQQISDRVDDINSELKSNFRKKLASQTTEANASDADLIAEKQGLTNILHNRLATLTGLAPEDIAGLRQNAGKLRSLAQEVGDSANKDTVTAGRADTSGGTTSMKNPLEGVVNRIGGGQEIIGNRTLKEALQNFKPAETPLPQPKPPGPGVATTPAAAQQEFAHQQALEQAAQDSSASRSADAAGVRERARLAEGGSSAWASKGYNNVIQQITADKPAGIKTGDLAAIAETPEGRSLFMRASSLQPGSAMLKQIVSQLSALAKGTK